METSSNISRQDIPWQATVPSFFMRLRNELLAANELPGIIPQRSPKELTKEATYTIYVMLAFILLSFLGTSVTAYEFFLDNGKKIKYHIIVYQEKSTNSVTRLEKKKESLKSKGWLENCKTFLKCFCMVKNGRSILNTISAEEQIHCIQGLRIVSNAWVILAHTGMIYIMSLKDAEQAKPLLDSRASQLLLNAKFSVDVFFVISGFLNAYFFSHEYSRFNGNTSWGFFYLKRFVRLTPVYMIVLGFYSTLFSYTGNGIIWPTFNTNPVCIRDWWWHLLYINNFEESANQCMLWSWYLAVDMQFYIISPLFMISLIRWPQFGYFMVFACITISCASSFMLTCRFHLTDGFSRLAFHLSDIRQFLINYWEYFDTVYSKPYSRISAYLVGITLGYYSYKKNIKKNSTRNSKGTLCCGWIVTISFMWFCFYWLHEIEGDWLMDTALYNGTKFFLFSCGVAWIIYVCLTGQAEFLNRCLSCNAFLPLARLSYCSYLIHPIILQRTIQQTVSPMDFSAMSLMTLYLHTCAFTYPISFIASILFEIPMLNILEWLSKKIKHKTSRLSDSACTTKFSYIHKIS